MRTIYDCLEEIRAAEEAGVSGIGRSTIVRCYHLAKYLATHPEPDDSTPEGRRASSLFWLGTTRRIRSVRESLDDWRGPTATEVRRSLLDIELKIKSMWREV